MSKGEFAFSSLGKFLSDREVVGTNQTIRDSLSAELDVEKEIMPEEFKNVLREVRDGLLSVVSFENPRQLMVLLRFAFLILLPEKAEQDRKGAFSNSKSYDVKKNEYSNRRVRTLAPRFFDTVKFREIFLPITSDPLFGSTFNRRLEEFICLGSDLKLHYDLIRQYINYVGNPSVLIAEIEVVWPKKSLKTLLDAFVSDLAGFDANHSLDGRLNDWWDNYLKYKSQRKRKTKKKSI